MFHAGLDLAPHGVLAIEETRVVEANEELRIRAVGHLSAGHRASPAHVRFGVEFRLQVGLVAAAHAGTGRVTALGHEAGDHTVEHDAIVETFAGQLRNSLNMARREIEAQLDDDIAALSVAAVESEGQRFVGHGGVSPVGSERRI